MSDETVVVSVVEDEWYPWYEFAEEQEDPDRYGDRFRVPADLWAAFLAAEAAYWPVREALVQFVLGSRPIDREETT